MYYEGAEALKTLTMEKYELDSNQVESVHPADIDNIINLVGVTVEKDEELARNLMDSINLALPEVLEKQLEFFFISTEDKKTAVKYMTPFIFKTLVSAFIQRTDSEEMLKYLYDGKKSKLSAKVMMPLLFSPSTVKRYVVSGEMYKEIWEKANLDADERYEEFYKAIPTGNITEFHEEVCELTRIYVPENMLMAVGHSLRRDWRADD